MAETAGSKGLDGAGYDGPTQAAGEVETSGTNRTADGSFALTGFTETESASVSIGETIGPYKLRQLLGEGGMGSVYLADQSDPVRREVALKIVKTGMDSKQVIARFEAERQALAIMDHPNIAKVFDGGATADGRPYFVMELVRGVPLTK